MENFSTLLKIERVKRNWSQEMLGAKLKVSKKAVSNWESGSEPNDIRKRQIENAMSLPIGFFNSNFQELPQNSLSIVGYATAGLLEEQIQQDLGYVEVPKKFANPQRYMAVKVTGDSMNRVFEDETVTIFDKTVQNFQNKIILVEINNQTTIKRFNDYGNVIVLSPESYNPNHQNITIKKEDIESLKIYGKLVYYCKEMP